MKRYSIEEIENAQNKVNQMKKRYLESNGWVYRSRYPRGFWLWSHDEKGYKGCSEDTAIDFQRYFDACSEAAD